MKRRLMTLALMLFAMSTVWAENVVLTDTCLTWREGNTYILNSDVTISSRITVSGGARLVLNAGFTLTASAGIELGLPNGLTIDGEGTLTATGTGDNAGIGAYLFGTLIINSGTINATGGDYGAGIGGSKHNHCSDGSLTINGGVVTATGGYYGGAGIGGGHNDWLGDMYGVADDIIINGGQVTATGGNNAAGIGCGRNGGNGYGSVTLGWTNETDFIYASSYNIARIACIFDQRFVLDGTEALATTSNIGGQKIVPYIPTTPEEPTPEEPVLKGDMNDDDELTIADVTLLVNAVLVQPPHHDFVDLDLPSGTLWATTNIGAQHPEDFSDYFAWGETVPYGQEDTSNAHNYATTGSYTRTTYDWTTYKWCNGSRETLTKYCNNSSCGNEGFVDNISYLEPEDDAATVNWGDKWRIPDQGQFAELINSEYTTSEWTTLNGVNGYKITSKSNGNSIFLPAAGIHFNAILDDVAERGSYWMRHIYWNIPYDALQLYFTSNVIKSTLYALRCYGYSIRPVRVQKNK